MIAKGGEIVARNERVWVPERYLLDVLGNLSIDYLRLCRHKYKSSLPPCHHPKSILPATGKSWRYARINGQFYYDYDFIPDRKDTRYRSRLGDKATLIQLAYESEIAAKEATQKEIAKELESHVTYLIDNRDIRIFSFYQVKGVCKFNHQKARQLAESLTWAKCIKKLITTGKYKDFGIETQAELYDICASVLFKKKLEGLRVTTGESLRKKLHYFPESEDAQYDFFVSDRYANDNARKLGKDKIVDKETGEIFSIDIHQALILDLWMNPGGSGKGSKIELWEEYKADLALVEFGVEPLSYSTFCHYTNSYDIRFKTARERHGEKYFNNMYLPYITSKKLTYANSLWCADGSGTIRYEFRDSKGVLRDRNLYVMMISDVATGKIVGHAFAPIGESSETPELVRTAMLNALQNTDKREVMEFVSDNHGAFTCAENKDFLESVCRRVRNIYPENSQANYAETQFRLFKKRLRRLNNWAGSSWGATSIENKADSKQVKRNPLPAYKEAIRQLEQKIDEWNNLVTRTGVSRSQLYTENIHPESQEIDAITWRRISGNFSTREITRQRGTIILEKRGTKHKFEVPNYEALGEAIQEYLGYANLVKTHIYWDEECADVYTEDKQYMFTCYKMPEACISQAEADVQNENVFENGMAKKAHSIRKVEKFKEDIVTASSLLHGKTEYHDTYEQACIGGGKVKERFNEACEMAIETSLQRKEKSKPKAKPRKQLVPEVDSEFMRMYQQKREELYKPQNN